MSILSAIGCLFNLHRPVRREVVWNGRSYVGECRHCGAPIERQGRRKWRRRSQAESDQREASTG